MPTRNVVLTERQEEFIEGLVKSGRYRDASEVLRDGLWLMEHARRRMGESWKLCGKRLASAPTHWIEASSINSRISKACKPI